MSYFLYKFSQFKSVKGNRRIFIFCTISTNGLSQYKCIMYLVQLIQMSLSIADTKVLCLVKMYRGKKIYKQPIQIYYSSRYSDAFPGLHLGIGVRTLGKFYLFACYNFCIQLHNGINSIVMNPLLFSHSCIGSKQFQFKRIRHSYSGNV